MLTEQERAEIIAELKAEMIKDKESPRLLKPTYEKWCKDPDYYHSRMRTALGGDGIVEAVVWDCIRKLVCKIMGVSYVRQIQDEDKANEIADELCGLVARLATEAREKDEDR